MHPALLQRSPGGRSLLTSSDDDVEAAAAACRGHLEGAIAAGDAAAAAEASESLLEATLSPVAASAGALRASLNPLFRRRTSSGGAAAGGGDGGEAREASALHLVPSGGDSAGELAAEATASSSHNPLFCTRTSSPFACAVGPGSTSEGGEAAQDLAAPDADASPEPSAAPMASSSSLNPLFRARTSVGVHGSSTSEGGEAVQHLAATGADVSGEPSSAPAASSSSLNPLFRQRTSSAVSAGGQGSEGGEVPPQHPAAPGAGVSTEPSAAPVACSSSLNPLFRARTSSCGSASLRRSEGGARHSQGGGPLPPRHLAASGADVGAAPSAELTASSLNPLYLSTLSSEVEAEALAGEAAAAPLLAAGAAAATAALACPNPLLAQHAAAEASAAEHAAAAVGHQVELLRQEVAVLRQALAGQEAAAAEERRAVALPGSAAYRVSAAPPARKPLAEAAQQQLAASQAALAGAETALVAAQAEAVAARAAAAALGVHLGTMPAACNAVANGSEVQRLSRLLSCRSQEAEELLQQVCRRSSGWKAAPDGGGLRLPATL